MIETTVWRVILRNGLNTLWKRDRTPRKSWSSPTLLVLDGVPQIVVSSDGTVDGYHPFS